MKRSCPSATNRSNEGMIPASRCADKATRPPAASTIPETRRPAPRSAADPVPDGMVRDAESSGGARVGTPRVSGALGARALRRSGLLRRPSPPWDACAPRSSRSRGCSRIEANGLRFACLQAGTGPPVLLIHGFPGTAYTPGTARWKRSPAPAVRRGVAAGGAIECLGTDSAIRLAGEGYLPQQAQRGANARGMRDGQRDELPHLLGAERRRRVGRAGAEVMADHDRRRAAQGVEDRQGVGAEGSRAVAPVRGDGVGNSRTGNTRPRGKARGGTPAGRTLPAPGAPRPVRGARCAAAGGERRGGAARVVAGNE
jgi:hypothetical protein